jgi:hypothetical protein
MIRRRTTLAVAPALDNSALIRTTITATAPIVLTRPADFAPAQRQRSKQVVIIEKDVSLRLASETENQSVIA